MLKKHAATSDYNHILLDNVEFSSIDFKKYFYWYAAFFKIKTLLLQKQI